MLSDQTRPLEIRIQPNLQMKVSPIVKVQVIQEEGVQTHLTMIPLMAQEDMIPWGITSAECPIVETGIGMEEVEVVFGSLVS